MTGTEMIQFAKRNGRMRLVCSTDLTEDDKSAADEGYQKRSEKIGAALLEEIRELEIDGDLQGRFKILSTMIALNVLEVKIAVRPGNQGIFHEKIGIFTDSNDNQVSFKGSSNETWSGWHIEGNHESNEVFCSWLNDIDQERVNKHFEYFQSLWSGNAPSVEIHDFPEAARHLLVSQASESLAGLEKEIQVIERERQQHKKELEPREHQTKAIQSWSEMGNRGILQHATGSGKTFTAILAIREHLRNDLPVIILVPSEILLEQWESELKKYLSATILLVGGGNNEWRKRSKLESFTSSISIDSPRIVVAIINTARSDEFLKRVQAGPHILIIADEVHQIGAQSYSEILQVDSGSRLGLSATPTRYLDPIGTQRIFDYFGNIVEPPFLLKDALEQKILTPYRYFPSPIQLDSDESEMWQKLTKEIGIEVAKAHSSSAGGDMSDRAKLLVIQRSRIAKKASAKIPLARQVVDDHFHETHHWLIYCEDQDQLRSVLFEIRKLGIDVNEYHTNMDGDRKATLDWFRAHGGVLAAIGCLDEGVDIPEISHALILASSQNPRQFIQRRGRVLRRSANKIFATIYDALVLPPHVDDEPDQGRLLEAELLRAMEFALLASNSTAITKMRDLAATVGLDPDRVEHVGIEDEN
jgi:superfamily II DNA or RNA helicase